MLKKDDKIKVHSINSPYDFLNEKIGKIMNIIPSRYDGKMIFKILFDDENIGSLYIRKEHLEVI